MPKSKSAYLTGKQARCVEFSGQARFFRIQTSQDFRITLEVSQLKCRTCHRIVHSTKERKTLIKHVSSYLTYELNIPLRKILAIPLHLIFMVLVSCTRLSAYGTSYWLAQCKAGKTKEFSRDSTSFFSVCLSKDQPKASEPLAHLVGKEWAQATRMIFGRVQFLRSSNQILNMIWRTQFEAIDR